MTPTCYVSCVLLHCSKFESRQNIYKGKIDIVATVTEAGFKPSEGTHNIAFDTITLDAANTKAGRRLHSSGSGARRLLQQGGDTSMPAKPGNIVRLKAPALGASDFPLDLKLSVKREGLTAAGTATITNTLNNIVEVRVEHVPARFRASKGHWWMHPGVPAARCDVVQGQVVYMTDSEVSRWYVLRYEHGCARMCAT